MPGIVVGFLCLKKGRGGGRLNDLSKLFPASSCWSQDLNTRLMFCLLYIWSVLSVDRSRKLQLPHLYCRKYWPSWSPKCFQFLKRLVAWVKEAKNLTQCLGHRKYSVNFPGKNTGIVCHFFLQEIFPTQELNPGLPHCRHMIYHLSHLGSLKMWVAWVKEGKNLTQCLGHRKYSVNGRIINNFSQVINGIGIGFCQADKLKHL